MKEILLERKKLQVIKIIGKDEPREHFQGILIDGESFDTTNAKVLIRLKNRTDYIKEEGEDLNLPIWISKKWIEEVLKVIPKKVEEIYIVKENGKLTAIIPQENFTNIEVNIPEEKSKEMVDNFPTKEKRDDILELKEVKEKITFDFDTLENLISTIKKIIKGKFHTITFYKDKTDIVKFIFDIDSTINEYGIGVIMSCKENEISEEKYNEVLKEDEKERE